MTFSFTPAISATCESRPSAPTTSLPRRVVSAPSRSRSVTPATASPSRTRAVAVCPRWRSTPGVAAAASRTIGSRTSRRRLSAEARLLGGRLHPAPLGPGLDPGAHAARRDDRVEQVQPFDRRHPGGLDEVRADALEGVRVGLLLDHGDAQALAPEEDRRRAAREAAADDHRVVVGGLGAVAGSGLHWVRPPA